MNELKILNADYIQCTIHQENMTSMEELKDHRTDECFMVPMKYKMHKPQLPKKPWLPQTVIDNTSMLIYREEKNATRKMMYTVPKGHMILNGNIDEFIKNNGEKR